MGIDTPLLTSFSLQPRFWCKQCKIFIRDTPFEKTQHEASPKHQGSLKRFLRDIHKNNDIKEREAQRAKSEVERLRKAVSGGSSTPQAGSSASAPAKRTAVSAPADRQVSADETKKRIAQLAEMGVAIPEEYRADMALAGDWQTVSVTKIEEPDEVATKSIGVRKRKHEGAEDDEEDQPPEQYENKGWGSRMRSYPGGRENDDEEEDLDALFASTKDLKKSKNTNLEPDAEDGPKPTIAPDGDEPSKQLPETANTPDIKAEEEDAATSSVKAAPTSEETSGPVFKKRKAKTMRK